MGIAKRKADNPRQLAAIPNSVKMFLNAYTRDVRSIAQRLRAFVREIAPDAIEQLDLSARIIGYGYSSRYADLVCVLMPLKARVNLGFARGAELPDPDRLLEGTGKRARHVKIRTAKDVENPGLRTLLKSAVAEVKGRASVPNRS